MSTASSTAPSARATSARPCRSRRRPQRAEANAPQRFMTYAAGPARRHTSGVVLTTAAYLTAAAKRAGPSVTSRRLPVAPRTTPRRCPRRRLLRLLIKPVIVDSKVLASRSQLCLAEGVIEHGRLEMTPPVPCREQQRLLASPSVTVKVRSDCWHHVRRDRHGSPAAADFGAPTTGLPLTQATERSTRIAALVRSTSLRRSSSTSPIRRAHQEHRRAIACLFSGGWPRWCPARPRSRA